MTTRMKKWKKITPAMPSRISRFKKLVEQAATCRICPNLADQPAVLSSCNGSLNAQVVFVAEAPGRFGAGRTGVPFSGDQSGKNLRPCSITPAGPAMKFSSPTPLSVIPCKTAITAAPLPGKFGIVILIWNRFLRSSSLKLSSLWELSVLKPSITSLGPNISSQKSSPGQ
jgi:Uracil DNA glycosylase superfamily